MACEDEIVDVVVGVVLVEYLCLQSPPLACQDVWQADLVGEEELCSAYPTLLAAASACTNEEVDGKVSLRQK